jgi:hypothetical protein
MEETTIKKQREVELQRNKLDLKIHWKDKENVVSVSKKNTLEELLEIIWDDFELYNEPGLGLQSELRLEEGSEGGLEGELESVLESESGFESKVESGFESESFVLKEFLDPTDVEVLGLKDAQKEDKKENQKEDQKENQKEDQKEDQKQDQKEDQKWPINYGQFRLRFFNIITKSYTDAFDITNGNRMLESLCFNSYRPMALEVRGKGDDWEVSLLGLGLGLGLGLLGLGLGLLGLGSWLWRLEEKMTNGR